MDSSFEQGENVAFPPNGDDRRNPNAKGQSSNKVQMSKFKGHTAGLGARDGGHTQRLVEIHWRYVGENGDDRLVSRRAALDVFGL